MSVYVDPLLTSIPTAAFDYRESSRLVADSLGELHAFARSLGLRTSWFKPTPHPHYTISRGMRNAAVREGAIELERSAATALFTKLRQHTGEPASCPAA